MRPRSGSATRWNSRNAATGSGKKKNATIDEGGEAALLERKTIRRPVDDRRPSFGDPPREVHHVLAVIDADGAAAGLECAAQKDPAAAADVEQSVVRCELERVQHGLPRERVDAVGPVCLNGPASVRPTGDTIDPAVEPPVADPLQ